MPLLQTVDSLDAIPEAARGAYVEKDGKFHLDFEVPDVVGLKNTVAATRAERDAFDAQLKAWKKTGKSPDEIAEMVEAARLKEEQAEIKAGNFDKVLAKKLGDQKLDGDKLLSAANTRADSALGIARNALIGSNLGAALTKAKATAEGIKALPTLIGNRVKIEFDDAGKATSSIMEADGKTPMVGNGPQGLATYDDLVNDAMKEFPSLFEGVGGGGGTPSKGGGGSGAKTMAEADFKALPPKERAAKMAEPGFRLT